MRYDTVGPSESRARASGFPGSAIGWEVANGRKAIPACDVRLQPLRNIPGLGLGDERRFRAFRERLLYNENPALGAGGSEALLAMGQDKKLLLM